MITKIYIHSSYSEWGDVDVVRKWHTDPKPQGRGWSDIGYHFVVYNQFTDFNTFKKIADARADEHGRYSDRLYSTHSDGQIVTGRPLSIRGAHVKNDNQYSIGIAYIGISPTAAQYSAMLHLCCDLIRKYPLIHVKDVIGHYEYWANRNEPEMKTCPNFNLTSFRSQLGNLLAND